MVTLKTIYLISECVWISPMKPYYLEEEGQKVLGCPDGSEHNPNSRVCTTDSLLLRPSHCCDFWSAGGCIASKPSVGQGCEGGSLICKVCGSGGDSAHGQQSLRSLWNVSILIELSSLAIWYSSLESGRLFMALWLDFCQDEESCNFHTHTHALKLSLSHFRTPFVCFWLDGRNT